MHAALVLSVLLLCLIVRVYSQGALKNFGNGFQANGGVFGQYGYASSNAHPIAHTSVGGHLQFLGSNAINGMNGNFGYYSSPTGLGGSVIGSGIASFNAGPGITSTVYPSLSSGIALPVGRYRGENDIDDLLDDYDDYMRRGRNRPRRYRNRRRRNFLRRIMHPRRFPRRFPGGFGRGGGGDDDDDDDDDDWDFDGDFDDIFDDDDGDDDDYDDDLDDLFDLFDDDDFDDLFDDLDDDDDRERYFRAFRRRRIRGLRRLRGFPRYGRRRRFRGPAFFGPSRRFGGPSRYGRFPRYGRSGGLFRYGRSPGSGGFRYGRRPGPGEYGFRGGNMGFIRPGLRPYRGLNVGRYGGEGIDIEGRYGSYRGGVPYHRSYGDYDDMSVGGNKGGSHKHKNRPRARYFKCTCQKKCPKHKINTGKCNRCKKKKKCKLARCCLRRRQKKG